MIAMISWLQIRVLHDYHLASANINKLASTEREGAMLIWPPRIRPNTTRTGGPPPRFQDGWFFVPLRFPLDAYILFSWCLMTRFLRNLQSVSSWKNMRAGRSGHVLRS